MGRNFRWRWSTLLPGRNRNFICFEAMTGVTNAMNLAYEGKYEGLQTIAPGGVWNEGYWIMAAGF